MVLQVHWKDGFHHRLRQYCKNSEADLSQKDNDWVYDEWYKKWAIAIWFIFAAHCNEIHPGWVDNLILKQAQILSVW